jgi:hypothetical protein
MVSEVVRLARSSDPDRSRRTEETLSVLPLVVEIRGTFRLAATRDREHRESRSWSTHRSATSSKRSSVARIRYFGQGCAHLDAHAGSMVR